MNLPIKSVVLVVVGVVAGYALAAEDLVGPYLPLRAAPDHHRPIFENDSVRVLDVRIAPGDMVPAHQHDLPSIFVTLGAADLVFRDLSGATVKSVRRDRSSEASAKVEWRDPAPAPRLVSNIDSVELHALRIELKTTSQ